MGFVLLMVLGLRYKVNEFIRSRKVYVMKGRELMLTG